jgi:predicted RecA/RadA family phage recombinase
LLRQRGGGVVTCAGNDVFLVPATASATSELRRVFGDDKGYVARGGDAVLGGGKLVVAPRPNRQGVCNAQGFFTFPNVRAGKWYVMTTVVWQVGDQNQGGTMVGAAVVAEGQEAEIVLSQ